MYKQKYLKYKQKYLEIKNQMIGGALNDINYQYDVNKKYTLFKKDGTVITVTPGEMFKDPVTGHLCIIRNIQALDSGLVNCLDINTRDPFTMKTDDLNNNIKLKRMHEDGFGKGDFIIHRDTGQMYYVVDFTQGPKITVNEWDCNARVGRDEDMDIIEFKDVTIYNNPCIPKSISTKLAIESIPHEQIDGPAFIEAIKDTTYIKERALNNQTIRLAIQYCNKNNSWNHPIYGNISNWNTRDVTDMSRMFFGAEAFNEPIGEWEVNDVNDMTGMFNGAEAFNQPIGKWKVDNVKIMNVMFLGALAFNQPIGEWKVDNVTSMRSMFSEAEAFNQPIGAWKVNKVGIMEGMFEGAEAFNQDISNWEVDEVYNSDNMFIQCPIDDDHKPPRFR